MYNVEKRSAVLENAAGFARLDAYIYGPVTKWRHWGMFIHWGNRLCVPLNAVQVKMPSEFLEVQIPPCVLMYDWDP